MILWCKLKMANIHVKQSADTLEISTSISPSVMLANVTILNNLRIDNIDVKEVVVDETKFLYATDYFVMHNDCFIRNKLFSNA